VAAVLVSSGGPLKKAREEKWRLDTASRAAKTAGKTAFNRAALDVSTVK
jgi:hypothetical protein